MAHITNIKVYVMPITSFDTHTVNGANGVNSVSTVALVGAVSTISGKHR